MKHPRAANFAWKCANGKYLYWFHNHGGRFIREHPQRRTIAYEDRNPVWLCGGVEADTPEGKVIRWSQPEIVLYDDDPYIRMSYPDLVEDGGKYFLTETQKDMARVHEIDPELLEGLWGQADRSASGDGGRRCWRCRPPASRCRPGRAARLARSSRRATRRGPTTAPRTCAGLHHRPVAAAGFAGRRPGAARQPHAGAARASACRPRPAARWRSCSTTAAARAAGTAIPGCSRPGKLHHVVAIVDGGPKIITFVVDGRLCDGGDFRQFGWGRFNPNYRGPGGDETLRIGAGVQGEVDGCGFTAGRSGRPRRSAIHDDESLRTSAVEPPPRRPTRVRYRVVAMAVLLAMVTYLDRACISVLAPDIARDLWLTEKQMGWVFSAFALAYAVFEIPTAWWADRRGTRSVLTRIVVWWSAFTIATAAAFNYVSLLVMRFLFGMGEAGAWPSVARTFSRWIRAASGAPCRGSSSPARIWRRPDADAGDPLTAVLHWRSDFRVVRHAGLRVGAGLVRWFRDDPAEHPAVNAAELRDDRGRRRPAAGTTPAGPTGGAVRPPQHAGAVPDVLSQQLHLLLLHHLAADVSGGKARRGATTLGLLPGCRCC